MDPLQWMGAVRMGVQTVDKNIRWTIPLKTVFVCYITVHLNYCIFVAFLDNV